ncbi:hypothetical protein [Dipodfec virus UOA04_Rod_690]|nr:hypothetical protein [Dipodfec virus UOA04_Rod_690]
MWYDYLYLGVVVLSVILNVVQFLLRSKYPIKHSDVERLLDNFLPKASTEKQEPAEEKEVIPEDIRVLMIKWLENLKKEEE